MTTKPLIQITDLLPLEDGRTAITYNVDYNGTASGMTVAELGPEPTEAEAAEFVASLYV